MRTVYICGSPKKGASMSAALLDRLNIHMPNETESLFIHTNSVNAENSSAEAYRAYKMSEGADALVIAFPLYVDGIPSHLLRFLEAYAAEISGKMRPKVYAIINCGFFDSDQCALAARMIGIWAAKNNLEYPAVLLIGGGATGPVAARGKFPGKQIGKRLKSLAEIVSENSNAEDTLIMTARPDFPRWMYMRSANRSWIKAAKKRGLSKDDIKEC